MSSKSGHSHDGTESLSGIAADAWFVGAFGRWWLASPLLDGWWFEGIKDEEGNALFEPSSRGSGLLGMKALNQPDGSPGNDWPLELSD